MNAAVKPRSRSRRWPWLLIAAAGLLAFLVFDTQPTLPDPVSPTALQAQKARELATRMSAGFSARGNVNLYAGPEEIRSTALLVSSRGKVGRVDARIEEDQLVLRASRPFGPVWLNLKAIVPSNPDGFPAARIWLGRLPLGETLSGHAIQLALRLALRGEARVPALDDLVRRVAINRAGLTIQLAPRKAGLDRALAAMGGSGADPALTREVYCALIEADTAKPDTDFAAVVRRAFRHPMSGSQEAAHRARFVALAIYTVGQPATNLAGSASARIDACGRPHATPLLRGRNDLPMHWAASAALAATAGSDFGAAVGELKELADSRPDGSGFSFVDLAADRSGLLVAKRGIDTGTSAAVAQAMQQVTAAQLLPIAVMAGEEGLSEAQFLARYRNLGSDVLVHTTARIDSIVLAGLGL